MKTFKEIQEAAHNYNKHKAFGITDGFIAGAKWMQEQDNWISVEQELKEKDLALGNAFRLLKQIDNTIGLNDGQRKRLEYIDNTIRKYFNVSDCLRIVQSKPLPSPPKQNI